MAGSDAVEPEETAREWVKTLTFDLQVRSPDANTSSMTSDGVEDDRSQDAESSRMVNQDSDGNKDTVRATIMRYKNAACTKLVSKRTQEANEYAPLGPC